MYNVLCISIDSNSNTNNTCVMLFCVSTILLSVCVCVIDG